MTLCVEPTEALLDQVMVWRGTDPAPTVNAGWNQSRMCQWKVRSSKKSIKTIRSLVCDALSAIVQFVQQGVRDHTSRTLTWQNLPEGPNGFPGQPFPND